MDTLDLDKLSDKVLDKIRRRPGQYYDIKYLAKCFKASDEGIHKSLEQLKKIGYIFKSDKSGRWALMPLARMNVDVTMKKINMMNTTSSIGVRLISFSSSSCLMELKCLRIFGFAPNDPSSTRLQAVQYASWPCASRL